MTKFLTIAFLFFLTSTISACNTMKGIGKDVERGGERYKTLQLALKKIPSKSVI